ncbi:hypothetical protein FALCPG4_012593 [Fusarium falciforme]
MTVAEKFSTALLANTKGKVMIEDFPIPPPRDDEILIQVIYSGVNASDFRVLKFFDCRRRVLVNEFCGKVLDGPGLAGTSFNAGDVVAGSVDGAQNDGTLVVWGASTSVGMAAIQLARASRVSSIIVTASPKRHEVLKTLGATRCFDYNDENPVDDTKALVENAGSGLIWGLDAIGTTSTTDSQTLLARGILEATEFAQRQRCWYPTNASKPLWPLATSRCPLVCPTDSA